MFHSGMNVKIKLGAWKRYLIAEKRDINTPLPPPQIITHMPPHPPYHDKVMLSFPFYWWHEDEVEVI